MWLLLLVLACNPERIIEETSAPPPPEAPEAGERAAVADVAEAPFFDPVPEVTIPSGHAIYRPECFGSPVFEDVARPSAKAMPPRAPTTSSMPAPPAAAPAAAEVGGGSEGFAAPEKRGAADAASSAAPVAEHEAAVADVGMEEAGEPTIAEKHVEQGPALDWGATVYLSNDDSMSLASAQRLLWAVENGRSFTPGQVRPHELLNYFSFDTAPVARHQLFSVLGSAEQTGDDTLSVALAVRGAVPPRKPLNLTVLVDRSGSMSAEGRMDYVKKGMRVMSDQLKPGDRIDVVLFDDRVCTPLEDYVVGRDDPRLFADTIEQMRPRGSTDLSKGLKEAYGLATARTEGIRRNTRVMVITDAFLNTGDVNEDSVSQIGRALEDQDIRLTGVGVGREFNDKVLDMLTEKGKGAYVYLGSERVVERVFGPGFESLTRTIAHDVHFALDLPESLAMERFYGEEASTRKEDVQPINYYAGTSQVFLQDLKMRKLKRTDPVTLTISYREADTGEPGEQVWTTTVGALLEGDSHNLHKARALMAWSEMLLARSMRADPCGAPVATYQQRASLLGDDVEIAYVNGLVGKMCHVEVPVAPPPAPASTAELKVKVDSDIAISSVDLVCGAWSGSEALTGSDNVARFQAPVGSCTIRLQGVVEMRAPVEVPLSGKSVRCLVRGGRLSCT